MSDAMTIRSHVGAYRVCFCDDALGQLNADVPADCHFIVDGRVAELYRESMGAILASDSVLLVDASEESKSLDAFPAYVQHLVDHGVRKKHKIYAIGGGITQDISCFLAATMLRGIDWCFYPTTLLAQADSCIGSKSSINCGGAKNILGTFTPPQEVYISTAFLGTLQDVDVRSGIGEMLKVHAIDGPDSFDAIAASYEDLFADKQVMKRFIHRSLRIKQGYIEKDEFDVGSRRVFNYGHSFGHAIEAATNFAIPHGVAVTMGADMANYISWQLGVGHQKGFERMHPVLKKNSRGFEDVTIPEDLFFSAIGKDKKNIGRGALTLILPDKDGRVHVGQYKNDHRFQGACRDFLAMMELQ